MSENIRVSEVSDILRKQLEGINANVQLDEIGTVLQVSDGVVRIYGLRNAEANELLEFDNGIKAIVMNLEEDNVGAVLLGPTDRIKEGFIVKRTKRIASIRVGESMLGRVIDPLGEPLDGKGLIGGELYEMPLEGLKDKVRDVFLVGCYTCQRFSDYARLEKENFTTTAKGTKVVRIVQEKTGNDVVIPILNDNLLHIAEKYGYDIPKVNDVILNRYIKQILKELSSTVPSLARKERTLLTMKEREKEKQGLVSFERDNKGNVIKPRYELVSSHTARRSGITNLYLSGNFDTYQMMSISGHRDEKTFYEYIKLSSDEVADSIAKKMDERKEAISNERLF